MLQASGQSSYQTCECRVPWPPYTWSNVWQTPTDWESCGMLINICSEYSTGKLVIESWLGMKGYLWRAQLFTSEAGGEGASPLNTWLYKGCYYMGSGTLCKTFMGGSLANYCLLFFQPRAKFACQILFGIQAVRCTYNTFWKQFSQCLVTGSCTQQLI